MYYNKIYNIICIQLTFHNTFLDEAVNVKFKLKCQCQMHCICQHVMLLKSQFLMLCNLSLYIHIKKLTNYHIHINLPKFLQRWIIILFDSSHRV